MKTEEIYTSEDFWQAVENNRSMVIKDHITLSFVQGRNLRHYSAEITGYGKGIIRVEDICLFQCFSGKISNIAFILFGNRTDEYAFLARLCKYNAVLENCHFIPISKEKEKTLFLFREMEDGAKIQGNSTSIGFSIIKNRNVDISDNYKSGTQKKEKTQWDEFHKGNYFFKTKANFFEVKTSIFDAENNVEEMLYSGEKLNIKNPCKERGEIKEIIKFDVSSGKWYLKSPDFISGGKYEVLWVADGDELLGHNVGQQIEYQENPYKVIDVVFYEDEEDELGYYHKIVLQPLNCGSMYWYAPNGVFRYSDHWGSISECNWDLKFNKNKEIEKIISSIDDIAKFYNKKEYLAVMEEYYNFSEKKRNRKKILGFCAWEDFKQIEPQI